MALGHKFNAKDAATLGRGAERYASASRSAVGRCQFHGCMSTGLRCSGRHLDHFTNAARHEGREGGNAPARWEATCRSPAGRLSFLGFQNWWGLKRLRRLLIHLGTPTECRGVVAPRSKSEVKLNGLFTNESSEV